MDGLIRLEQQQMAYLEEQFGSQMPRHILSNGWDYYSNRRVLTTEVIDGNSIYGAVNGSSVYAVVLDSDEFGYSKCTCDYEGYCKHMAAVYYQYCALIGMDPEEMYRHLISEGTIEQKRMKREMAAKRRRIMPGLLYGENGSARCTARCGSNASNRSIRCRQCCLK